MRQLQIPMSGMSVEVRNDPLGPVNKIITMLNCGYPVKSVLYPVNEGSIVQFGNVPITFGPSWLEMNGHADPNKRDVLMPFWYVDVDGKRIMEVPDSEAWPPAPPALKPPRRVRLRQWYRGIPDRIAGHFGFVRDYGQDDY